METNYQESKSVIEAKLIMNLGMACRLALMPNLMKCPTVRQRATELEQYLKNNTCTEVFKINFIEFTGQLNEISSMRVNCVNKVLLFRLKQQEKPVIHISNRISDWKNRQLIATEAGHE
jgi:hypothetical protein